MYFDGITDYLLPILLTPFIIAFASSKKALTCGGIASAILLDLAVSLAFGNAGFVVLCSFFLGAIAVDKIKKLAKKQTNIDKNDDKNGRNYIQVIANGFVAFVSSVAYLLSGNALCIIPFVTSLAEAFSDTVASGIGVFATRTYDPFRRRRCDGGLSGGMSVVGTFSSLLGALLISYIAYALGLVGYGIRELFIVAACAFLGAIFDSMLGSLIQVKYRCTVCGALTEKEEHCGAPTVKESGITAIDNDVVNILSCTFASILALVLVLVI
jgi:uncharacterized protein (TIGR00297 family)